MRQRRGECAKTAPTMKHWRFLLLVLSLSFTGVRASGENLCREILSPSDDLVHSVSQAVEKDLKGKGFSKREARGYAILISTMIGSAAATTYLSSSLPSDFQFVSHFIAQVSTLGVYVFGAPIWEPLSSRFRKVAFGVRGADNPEENFLKPEFESLWRRTQENYSLNAQMSRNVINQFLISVHQNFYEAHRAVKSGDKNYAADQVAEAAFRLKTLFRDIDPSDASVASAVKTSFTNHVVVDAEFVQSVLDRIAKLDPSFAAVESRAYYDELLGVWL